MENNNGKDYSWVRYIHYRIFVQNKNFLPILTGPTGSGKCLKKGSNVLLSSGEWKKIEDIKIGDEVISPQKDGSNIFSKITATNRWFSKENYDVITLNRGKRLLYSCSSNHKIPVYNLVGEKHKTWVLQNYSAKEINLMSKNRKNHRSIGFSSFPIKKFKQNKDCKVEPYSLGVFLGDGMFRNHIEYKINKEYNKIKRKDKKKFHRKVHNDLIITTINFEIIKEISKHYPIMNVYKKYGTNAKGYSFSINGKFSKELKECGLEGKKSGNKFIPQKALTSNIDYRRKLLAGLIDTDGYLSKSCSYSITTKSYKLAKDILFLVSSLGGKGKINKIDKGIKSIDFIGTYYHVSFFFNNTNEIPMKLVRKNKKGKSCYINSNRIAIDCVPSKPSVVYGIEVDSPSHLFITNDFMVTHNSWCALSLGEMLDPNFCIERVIFKGRELMDLINSGKLKRGSVIVWDEAGVDLSSRNWQSLTNKMLNYLLQTFRHMNFVLIFTVPYNDFLDVASRKLFHAEFETVSINKQKQTCRIKAKLLQYNADMKKWYKKYLKVAKKDVGMSTIKRWDIPRPSDELIEAYEKKKNEFTSSLNKEIETKLEKQKRKEEEPEERVENFTRALTRKQAAVLHIWKQGIFKQKDIAVMLRISDGNLSATIKSMRKKGCKMEDYRDNKENFIKISTFSDNLKKSIPNPN